MLLMVIERFRDQNAKAVCSRLAEKGRLMPERLEFLDSWVTADLSRCFQLMQCDDVTLLSGSSADRGNTFLTVNICFAPK